MKKLLTAVLMVGILLSSAAMADVDVLDVDQSKYTNLPGFLGWVPDRFIVVLKDDVDIDHSKDMNSTMALSNLTGFDELVRQHGVIKTKPQFPGADRGPKAASSGARALARHYKVYLGSDNLDEAIAAYEANPMVDYVERIGIHTLSATPNDTYYDDPPVSFPHDQWHYWDTYGIEADMAWDDETGAQTVIVGDLDIGTKYDHGDLGGSNPPGPDDASTNGNIWVNTGETPGNGQDDDGNGYVDDIIGWDFVESGNWYPSYPCVDADCGGADNDPSDGDGHGTHTAGTIAAITNNGYAVAGVAGGYGDGTFAGGGNGVKIVPCRIGYVLNYFGQNIGVVIMDYVAEAMYYMADLKTSGWNVAAINCSFGSSNSGGLSAAATYLISQDVIIVVAAGNSNSSSADYLGSRGDCLDVGATDQNGNPASFSNYGTWVDIAAPGVEVMSTITDPANPDVDYVAYMDGTSMSAPHVAGVVALLESYDPSLTAAQKIAIITDPANVKAYNQTKDVGEGIVDARKCLDAVGPQCDLVADFSGSPTSGCAPLAVSFTDLSTGTGIDGWLWDLGDGVGTSTAQNPNYTYPNPGTYTVSLTVSSSSQNCDDTETKTGYITVDGGPSADFSGSPTSGTEPLTVDFTDLSTDATSWSWDFGDLGSSTQQNPSHTYNNAGTYTVTLTATNACGSDVATKVDYITVDPCVPPTADFSGSPTTGTEPLTVDFTDLSTSATSWSWDFGDGVGTSTQQNPSYTYNNAGTYTVTLTATNSCGSDVETKVNYITVDPCVPPTADFSGSPTTGTAPLSVDFTDLSTGATSWSWDFGDLGTSTQQNPSHQYTATGTYTVTLTATNACGSDVATKVDYITVDPPSNEKAYALSDIPILGTFSGNYTNTHASDNVYEVITEALSTSHPVKETSQAEHKWDFNVGSGGSNMMFYAEAYRPDNSDGDDFIFEYSTDDVSYNSLFTVTSGTEQVYSATLPAGLTGTIYVKVRDDNRSWDLISLDAVYIDQMYFEYETTPAPPVADFSGNPTSGNYPLTVNFADLSTGSPTSWSWDFGDLGTSTAQNPSHPYTAVGKYTVSLTVTNAYGSDTETKIDYINVTEPGQDFSHVHDMAVGRIKVGPNNKGTCRVTIYDQANAPLANATVYVSYDGPNSGSLSGVTSGDGTVYFESAPYKKPPVEWCFEVTDVTHGTHTYDAASNNVTRACESGWIYSNGSGGMAAVDEPLPSEFGLSQNYPNPFNPTTEISFTLPSAMKVTLRVYNVLGQKIATLASGTLSAGPHSYTWDGSPYSSGLYFYRLQADDLIETRKMILMK